MREATMLNTSMVAMVVLTAGAAMAATEFFCNASICVGSQGNDDLFGGSDANSLYALAGNDFVNGLAGDDTICGSDDSDKRNRNPKVYPHGGLIGAEDSDIVYGGRGDDVIDLASFDSPSASTIPPIDHAFGESGNDTVYAADGNRDIVVDCGGGKRDTVRYDENLDAIKNCEIEHAS